MEDPTQGGKFCGAKVRHREGFCRKPAGWGVKGVSSGRCRLHGGASLIKHGLYAKNLPDSIQQRLDEWDKVKDEKLNDLSREIRVARAMVEAHLEQVPDPDEKGLVIFTGKGMADFTHAVGVWMERVAKLTEAQDRIKRGNRLTITTESVERLLESVTDILMTYVPEEKQQEAMSALRDASR